ncbi:hypothetical protein [Campylobacter helveticus]|uniref:hypothetical protein n=1 Tax=Campylobacter helveticus TaxID=28898 RepID=UPI0009C2C177|nr:hypothetical protein [Campylobacter helveticus]ARE81408.1 hypothetical protein CHELV3228_a0033 [Campylobacter helveticus]SMC22331.1 hypothetical protein SAMN02745125_01375 [Campylobacter helveticus]SUW87732.1 putative DNA methylase [Campylobacter helveticus]
MKPLFESFKNKIDTARKNRQEKRGIYNVSFNEKDSTLIEAELEFIENAVIDYIKDYSFYYVKGYHNPDRDKGLGAEHIKLHLEPNSDGQITLEELLNLGNSIRTYLQIFNEPFMEENKNAKIYEWENDKGVRFRAITDKIGHKHLENITKAYQEGGPQLPLSPLDEQIITFYSDRNLNEKMEFKNPKVREYYESKQTQNEKNLNKDESLSFQTPKLRLRK